MGKEVINQLESIKGRGKKDSVGFMKVNCLKGRVRMNWFLQKCKLENIETPNISSCYIGYESVNSI